MPAAGVTPDLSSALRIQVTRLNRRLRSEAGDDRLSLTQFSALASLDRHGPMTPSALAEHERVQPPSITRVLGTLEERGLVERRPHPSDRRQCVIAVVPEGRALVAEDRRRRDAWLARQIRTLPPEDREALRAAIPVLERLNLA